MIRRIVFTPAGGGFFSPLAELVEWLAPVNSWLDAGDPLCVYEVDKTTSVFNSPGPGFLRRILVDPGGRFARGDALADLAGSLEEPLPKPPESRPALVPDEFDWGEIDNRSGDPEPLASMRRAIATRMSMSKRHIPSFHLTFSADMSSAKDRRQQMRKNGGLAATFNDMAVKAAALALARNPRAAAVFTPSGIVPRQDLNIGFAAALPDDGLVVPVVHNADRKALGDIAAETRRLSELAKAGKLRPEDCAGGVFSVSYLGAFDVDEFAAIVNPGESAIAAVGKPQDAPVVVNGEVVVRTMIRITLTCDHRTIDGMLAAKLASDFKRYLEHAESM